MEEKTNNFVGCGLLFLVYTIIIACGTGLFIFLLTKSPNEIINIIGDYAYVMGVDETNVVAYITSTLVTNIVRLCFGIYYTTMVFIYSTYTKAKFLQMNNKQVLDFILILFFIGIIPAIVYNHITVKNKLKPLANQEIYLPNGVGSDIANKVKVLQQYKQEGRITEEKYNELLKDLFVDKK